MSIEEEVKQVVIGGLSSGALTYMDARHDKDYSYFEVRFKVPVGKGKPVNRYPLTDRISKLEDNAGYDNGRILGLDARLSILEHQLNAHKADHMPSPRDILKGPQDRA